MGADLGGIAERIRNGVDGWLLPFDDSSAWATAIQEIALDRAKLRANCFEHRAVPQTMGRCRRPEMAALYREILAAPPNESGTA